MNALPLHTRIVYVKDNLVRIERRGPGASVEEFPNPDAVASDILHEEVYLGLYQRNGCEIALCVSPAALTQIAEDEAERVVMDGREARYFTFPVGQFALIRYPADHEFDHHYMLRFVPTDGTRPMEMRSLGNVRPRNSFCLGDDWEAAVEEARRIMVRFLASGYRLARPLHCTKENGAAVMSYADPYTSASATSIV